MIHLFNPSLNLNTLRIEKRNLVSFNEYWQAEQNRQAIAALLPDLNTGGKEAQQKLSQLLQKARLLLPLKSLPPNYQTGDLVRRNQKVNLDLVTLTAKDSKLYFLVFTNEAQLQKATSEEQPYLVLPFMSIATQALKLKAAGILINHGHETPALLPAASLAQLINATQKTAAKKGGQLQILPIPRPITLSQILFIEDSLRQQPKVLDAYLFGLRHPKQKKATLTVGLLCRTALNKEQLHALANQIAKQLGKSAVVTMNDKWLPLLKRQTGIIHFDGLTPENEGQWLLSAPPPQST